MNVLEAISSEQLIEWSRRATDELAAGWVDPHNEYGRGFRQLQVNSWGGGCAAVESEHTKSFGI